ncbi:MAG TPA: riboflavin synthase [Flavobacteriales bacterium]|nr:riboflavin synthase [Flavobacteriales bacterium]
MFTGIVEEVGAVAAVRDEGSNRVLTIRARMAAELKVDQSVSHNGVCLTVTRLLGDAYEVAAVKETLERTNLGALRVADSVNLERSLRIGDRLDGHMVQGHVDATVHCTDMRDESGSWSFRFELPATPKLLVQKGSICLNGVSLTVANLDDQGFGVAIIPYTHEHTTFKSLRPGDAVNVEYDVLGKYVERMMAGR